MIKPLINTNPIQSSPAYFNLTKKDVILKIAEEAFKALATQLQKVCNLLIKSFKRIFEALVFVIDLIRYGRESAYLFSNLNNSGVPLTQKQKAFVHVQVRKTSLVEDISKLHKAGVLDLGHIDLLLLQPFPMPIIGDIKKLHHKNILNLDILNKILVGEISFGDTTALVKLHKKNLLDQDMLSLILNHKISMNTALSFLDLDTCEILNPETKKIVLEHKHPSHAAHALCFLQASNLLNEENKQAVLTHPNMQYLIQIITMLFTQRRILTQNALNQLLGAETLLTQALFTEFWAHIPQELVTLELISQVYTLSQEADGRDQILALRDRLLQNFRRVDHQQINNSQSTHTKSVHKSVSESAIRLMEKYGDKIHRLDALIQELQQKIASSDHDKMQIAQKAITRLTDPRMTFEDPTSQVSIKQLLGLMHLTECPLENIILALYEAQREYNLTDQGQDLNPNADDRSACLSGTFNKLMQGLQIAGVPEVEILFITKDTASSKLPRAVFNYCMHKKILKISENNWADIKTHLKKEMKEFKCVFNSDEEFDQFLEFAREIEISDAALQDAFVKYCKKQKIQKITENHWADMKTHLKEVLKDFVQVFENEEEFEKFIENGKNLVLE